MKRVKWVYLCTGILLIATVGTGAYFVIHRYKTSSSAPSTYGVPRSTKATPKQTPAQSSFDKQRYSLTDPASIWVVVNKKHSLQPQNYAPTDLAFPNLPLRVPGNESMQIRQVVLPDLAAMFADAKAAGAPMMVSSAYRSYSYQVSLYGTYVQQHGQADADTFSARPGFSEHQSGLAIDVEPADGSCDISECFANTVAGKWVAEHAYEYGFIMRYPADKVAITGYTYEPWHFRYVGKALATELHKQHIETLEEFFGISGGDYAPQ
jgi:zinc D-Ala-D-Ala carboxypeptidase